MEALKIVFCIFAANFPFSWKILVAFWFIKENGKMKEITFSCWKNFVSSIKKLLIVFVFCQTDNFRPILYTDNFFPVDLISFVFLLIIRLNELKRQTAIYCLKKKNFFLAEFSLLILSWFCIRSQKYRTETNIDYFFFWKTDFLKEAISLAGE